MYIKKIQVSNLKSIDDFEMNLDAAPGWHVLLGENGAGKTTVLRAIALALIGPEEIRALRLVLADLVQRGKNTADVKVAITRGSMDGADEKAKLPLKDSFTTSIQLEINQKLGNNAVNVNHSKIPLQYIWANTPGWFSISFGAYRRFSKDPQENNHFFKSNPRAAAHLSIFGENVGFTETLSWLSLLRYQTYEDNQDAILILESLILFINNGDLLPNNTELHDISSDGVTFVDGNHNYVDVMQLSEGYKSVLSMIFELIRQLVRVYGADSVFASIKRGQMAIDVEGVVLIDEIDAHLHPTWQAQIGNWFIKYFPNIQFIVTTHSPLICRASENGTIWRLAAPGSEMVSGKIVGADFDRLIYGNVLDAYGTELFGKDVDISEESIAQRLRLIELTRKHFSGPLDDQEQKEFLRLKRIFATDDPIEL